MEITIRKWNTVIRDSIIPHGNKRSIEYNDDKRLYREIYITWRKWEIVAWEWKLITWIVFFLSQEVPFSGVQWCMGTFILPHTFDSFLLSLIYCLLYPPRYFTDLRCGSFYACLKCLTCYRSFASIRCLLDHWLLKVGETGTMKSKICKLVKCILFPIPPRF